MLVVRQNTLAPATRTTATNVRILGASKPWKGATGLHEEHQPVLRSRRGGDEVGAVARMLES